MGFLKLDDNHQSTMVATQNYEKLGYLKNPFPPKGQVCPEVYVERPELKELSRALHSFLSSRKSGGFWVIESERGVGKSNFLKHLEWEFNQAYSNGQLEGTVHQYIPGPQVEPQLLVEYLLQAVGEERFNRLLKTGISLPESSKGTDLYRFIFSLKTSPEKATSRSSASQPSLFHEPEIEKKPEEDLWSEPTSFLIRWLAGHQTYTKERERYNIWSKDRMPPAVAFPYLRLLVEEMGHHQILQRLVLLLDEFEDIQMLNNQAQSEYILALKNLLNSFNWQGLFMIIAGQSATFSTIGSRYTSISDRWERTSLKPVQISEDAVKLARAYMEFAHQEYLQRHRSKKSQPVEKLAPSEKDIKVIFADGDQPVTQRNFLQKLHEWIEQKCLPN